MAKIKVLIKPGADMGTICDEILAAAAQGMPGSNPNAAEPVRDGNGKVVSVSVNLPDGDAPGLQNAADKINQNNGVSKAGPYPFKAADDDFSDFTPGTTFLDLENGPATYNWNGGVTPANSIQCTFPSSNGNVNQLLRAAYANESVGGTGSAFMIQFRDLAGGDEGGEFYNLDVLFQGTVALSGLVEPVSRIKYNFDVLFPTTINSVACLTPTAQSFDIRTSGVGGNSVSLSFPVVGPNSTIKVHSSGNPVADSGVTASSSHSVEIIMDYSNGSMHIVTIDGGSPILLNSPGLGPITSFGLQAPSYNVEVPSSGAYANEVPPVILDNMVWTILS